MVAHFALSVFILSLMVSTTLGAKCSGSIDCVSSSPCTVDFCEPIFRECISAGPADCPDARAVEISRFALLRTAEYNKLNLEERLKIVMQAERLFRDIHPHRPLHLNFLKVDPAAILRNFARSVRKSGGRGSVVDFHNRMIAIFQKIDDRHTAYRPPVPLSDIIAFLPFQVREFYAPSKAGDFSVLRPNYTVSDVAAKAQFSNPAFEKGVQIVTWNGVAISEAVMEEGREGFGSSRHAKHRLGLKSLTVKRLMFERIPRRDDVEVGFITTGGKKSTISIPWTLVNSHFAAPEPTADPESTASPQSTFGTPPIYLDFLYRLRSGHRAREVDHKSGISEACSAHPPVKQISPRSLAISILARSAF